jgi:sugar phosphate isomerase/epimerase
VRLGLFTACLPGLSLDNIAAWAGDNGFEALEVAAWPRTGARSFEASHLDVAGFGEAAAEAVRALLDKHGLVLSAIGYYDNNLHPDAGTRAAAHEHLRRCIDAAQLLGVPHVGTFIGRDWSRPVRDNCRDAEQIVPPLVEYAADRDVKLVIENCPMEGWHPDGYPGNLAYSPELWEWMFGLGLYLNYDPSHLLPLGIDPVSALKPYLDRVLHVQAKDAEIDTIARNRYGCFGRTVERKDGWDTGWWRYRIPGLGSVDWRRVIDTLYQGGYDGAVSIEHEDPVWGGTEHRVMQGLRIARQTLRPLIAA